MHVLALLLTTALAAKEGIVVVKLVTPEMTATTSIAFSPAGALVFSEMRTAGEVRRLPLRLWMAKTPDVGFEVNGLVCQEFDVRRIRDQHRRDDLAHLSHYTVKKLGDFRTFGYASTRSILTDSKGREYEVWSSTEVMTPEILALFRELHWAKQFDSGIPTELGFLLDVQPRGEQKATDVHMNITDVAQRSFPASTFELPANCRRCRGENCLSKEQRAELAARCKQNKTFCDLEKTRESSF